MEVRPRPDPGEVEKEEKMAFKMLHSFLLSRDSDLHIVNISSVLLSVQKTGLRAVEGEKFAFQRLKSLQLCLICLFLRHL